MKGLGLRKQSSRITARNVANVDEPEYSKHTDGHELKTPFEDTASYGK